MLFRGCVLSSSFIHVRYTHANLCLLIFSRKCVLSSSLIHVGHTHTQVCLVSGLGGPPSSVFTCPLCLLICNWCVLLSSLICTCPPSSALAILTQVFLVSSWWFFCPPSSMFAVLTCPLCLLVCCVLLSSHICVRHTHTLMMDDKRLQQMMNHG